MGKKLRPLKEVLGFTNGYVTIFQGETYPLLDWFRQSVARYNRLWGWYITSEDEIPEELPAGIRPIRLQWANIAISDDELRSESDIMEVINAVLYPEPEGEFIGDVGERIEVYLTVERVIHLDDDYNSGKVMHIFFDDLGNTYVWTTAARVLEEEKTYLIRGTVKDHRIYKGTRQTILTRCMLR